MTLGLRDIEYFIAIAERGNLGRAAESLALSQPALSKSLRRLESATQTKLVKKTPKGVELTAVGSAFLTHVRRIRLSMNDLAQEVADLAQGRAGHVRVGTNYYFSEYILPTICCALLRDTSKITLQVTVGANDVLLPALRNGQLDLIVSTATPYSEKDLVQLHLFDDELVVCASPAHRVARLKRPSMADISQEKWALSPDTLPAQWLRRAFEDRGFQPPLVGLETTSLALRLQTVCGSELLAFVPRMTVRQARPRLVELPIKELVWRRPLAVRYRKDAYLSPAARRLIEILKAKAEATAKVH